jgi:hypothetical protein
MLPSSSPPRQYRCTIRNSAISGMMVTRPPTTSIGYRFASPLFTARFDHRPRPTVSGYLVLTLKMSSGRK